VRHDLINTVYEETTDEKMGDRRLKESGCKSSFDLPPRASFGSRAQFGKVDRPSLVGDHTNGGDDIGDEMIADDVVEIM